MKKKFLIILLLAFSYNNWSQSGLVNQGFESTAAGAYTTANAVNGWTVDSRFANGACTYSFWSAGSPEFSVIATPMMNWPFASSPIGIIPHSPLGGTKVVQLNSTSTNSMMTRIRQTFTVTSADALLQFAYAGYWELASGHNCCQRPGVNFKLYDCSGTPLPCFSYSLFPGNGCNSSMATYSTSSNGDNWANWQTNTIDLSYYIGSCITVEVITTDCSFGHYFGTTLLDIKTTAVYLGSPLLPPLTEVPNGASHDQVFCPGSSTAAIYGPYGTYQYQWSAPSTGTVPPPQGTMSVLTVSNPVAGAVYTLTSISPNGCQTVRTYTLSNTQIDIVGAAMKPACPTTANGSATVLAAGSTAGYSYQWINSSNSVISTQSVVSGLPVGNYTVTVSGQPSLGCGSDTQTVSIGTKTPSVNKVIQPFCGSEAYLQAPLTATNIQWYNNTTPISSSLLSVPAYTLTSPCNGCKFSVAYDYLGCRDSTSFELFLSSSGSLTVPFTEIKPTCLSPGTGTAAIQLTPVGGVIPGWNNFFVTSTGTTSPFTSSLNFSFSNTYTLGGLSHGSYSVSAFDGACKYSTLFYVAPVVFDFNMSTSETTLCAGQSLQAEIVFSSTSTIHPYTYSWSPTTWLSGGIGTFKGTIIHPSSVLPGSIITTIYTVVVTPQTGPCPRSQTMAITAANPTVNSVSALKPMCDNYAAQTVITDPPGGTFLNELLTPNLVDSIGTVNPAHAVPGTNSFSYAVNIGSCVATKSSTFHVSKFNSAQLGSVQLPLCVNSPPFDLKTLTQNTTGIWQGPGVQNTFFNAGAVSNGSYVLTYSTFSSPDSTLCPDNSNLFVTVAQLPPVSANSGSLCSGHNFTISATGAHSFSYSGGSAIVQPASTTNYSVWGQTKEGCLSPTAAVITVSVLLSPTVTISGNRDSLCYGETATLTASGASSYFWTNGPATHSYVVQPFVSTHFKVTGENNGCLTAAQYYVDVRHCTSVEKIPDSDLYSIFPNPAKEKLQLQTKSDQSHILKIYNSGGKLLRTETVEGTNHTIDLSTLPAGAYQLHLNSATEKNKVFTFIKE